ncbi:hypothetical protein CHH78_01030 [Shouchella clausii]|uniref:ABC-2 transporter permease n=2 Tax=Shouchella clausii TaxID=79880 RepID=UPI000BA7AD0E|nr:ABC-2 transporter permease [Shouchella clausii]MBU8595452.1 ABC-2 transporter permease [Shouchella clausii]MED4157277.1 ABC-2 transporter permease [Shouchella clausii]MED4178038.1 ABC-2 transporter permease [Shouchella clausii]PAD10651.1 hypothetical protein CHH76_03445 [Shouchella clausii]PAD92846.1 hypothetical protein CHH52_07685 [Shouchella clausii]
MKGLMLNQYYSVARSILLYGMISIFVTSILLVAQIEAVERFVSFIPTILLVLPAMEVLKHESMSGWNKFARTLPVRQNQIVQSHYLFFVVLLAIGLAITIVLSLLSSVMVGQSLDISTVASIMNGIAIAVIFGTFSFPLTYMFGSEKADGILVFAGLAAFGLYLLSAWLYGKIFENVSFTFVEEMHPDLFFSILFLGISAVLFFISYLLASQVYKQKEF